MRVGLLLMLWDTTSMIALLLHLDEDMSLADIKTPCRSLIGID